MNMHEAWQPLIGNIVAEYSWVLMFLYDPIHKHNQNFTIQASEETSSIFSTMEGGAMGGEGDA